MSQRPFVHLHCHTHYSLLDGASRVPELVQLTKSLGMNSIAITDHGNLFGAIEFYKECKSAGINPIVGYEAYVAPGKRGEREAKRRGEAGFHLTLLAQNTAGFKNLVKMSSLAYIEGYHYVPRIDKELLAAHSEGIICLSGCASSEFSDFVLKEQMDEATDLARWFHTVFGKNFYVEIQNNGLDIQKRCAEGAVDIANRLGLPLVATCDAHYLRQEDNLPHDVLLCINTGRTIKDENRMRYGSDQFYVRPPEEMYRLFPGHEEAVKRSQEIADGVDIQIDFKARHFPVFTPPKGKKPEKYLRELCELGLMERYGPEASADAQARLPEAQKRMEHELGVIERMGFASYFLIVWDFVRFAISKNIPASARGSACGATVSYVLRLSHVCPLEYDLLFERFLDPNRSEAPDIDIDFCQDRREDVIQYVRERYGESSVAQIGTFGTMAAKAAIKDVGRVMDIPLDRVIRLTAMVPAVLNITLDDALQQSPDLKKEYDTDPEIRKMIDIARKLEGTNRQAGTHAAGVVIADGPIINFVPVQRILRKGYDNGNRGGEPVITTQWVMGDLEKVGMLKMDFLGLRTLTVIDNAIKLIAKNRLPHPTDSADHRNESVTPEKLEAIKDSDPRTYDLLKRSIDRIPLDDRATYALLQRGDAKGVFQLESDGIRELLKRMKPDNIRDLIATNALYRPGPLGGGMVDAYVNRKHGREKAVYVHPVMEDVLSETFNVMVYQEQVMRVLNRLGGIELASAYACIKAISKKKQEIMDARKVEFIQGAQKQGVTEKEAETIWDFIVQFAGYGFNKCVVAETVLIHAETGERTTVGDLFRNQRPFVVHALGDDGKLRPRPVTDVVWNGRKEVFRLKTRLGNTISATGNHPLRTLNGWKHLADLQIGERIATPRRIDVKDGYSWPRHEIITLAGLLSEGNTCHPSSLYFFGNDSVLVEDFAAAIAQFPNTVARTTTRRQGIHEVCANTGKSALFRKGQTPWNAAGNEVATLEAPTRSGAFLWADRLGIRGRKATEKFVPAGVFPLCDADIELFLGRLWAGDGFIANHALRVPFYATSSRRLAEDVHTLLLRIGIVSRIHEKHFRYRDQLRPGFTVHLLGNDSISAFVDRIAPHCLGREKAVALLIEYRASVEPGLTSKDTIPAEVRAWVDEERKRAGLTWKQLEEQSEVCMKEFQYKGAVGKRGFRRATIAKLAAFFGSQRLNDIAHSDVFWDTVGAIEPLDVQDTYDLTVDVDHNFVADGLIVHNSHSAAYALLGYQTAYLKTHYTPEFMAALLSSEIEDSAKRDLMVQHIDDARKLGVEVCPPDVQTCEPDFTVDRGRILFGLCAIKGLGRGAAEEILRARNEEGVFKDLFNFCERIDHKVVPKAALEKLIKGGAFDRLGAHRAQLLEALPRAIESAGQAQQDRRHGQGNLFESFGEGNGSGGEEKVDGLREIPRWAPAEQLKFEKEALDFYVSSHPLAQYQDTLDRFAPTKVKDLVALAPNQEIFMGGMLTQVRFMNTKKARNGNSRYVRCKLEDFSGAAECVIWPDDYVKYKDLVEEDRIVFVQGTVERNRDEPGLILTRVMTMEQGQKERTTGLVLLMSLRHHLPSQMESIAQVLQRSRGNVPVFLHVQDAAGKWLKLKASDEFRINPATLPKEDLEVILGPGRVEFARQGSGGR